MEFSRFGASIATVRKSSGRARPGRLAAARAAPYFAT
jgi:hypothetical protein